MKKAKIQQNMIKIKKLVPEASIPEYATAGACCFDIKTTTAGDLFAGQSKVFSTGLSFEVPDGWVLLIYSRSGHGFKNSVRLSNCVGVIDSDYRGELKVSLQNDTTPDKVSLVEGAMVIKVGDRIAQGMLLPVSRTTFTVVEELTETDRGTGGLGSTGA